MRGTLQAAEANFQLVVLRMTLNQRQMVSSPSPAHGNVDNALLCGTEQLHLGDFPLSCSKAAFPLGQNCGAHTAAPR